MVRSFFFLTVVGAALASTAACAAVFGFERLSPEAADALVSDAQTDVSEPDGAGEAGAACGELGLPSKPVAPPGDSGVPLHFALSVFDFGIDRTIPAPGFNLDRQCSSDVLHSSCATNASEATFDKYARDLGDHGVDNAGYGLLDYLSYLGGAFRPTEVNKRLAGGEFGFVLRLVGWNRSSEDSDVLVEIFPAIGVTQDADAAVPVVSGMPGFFARDMWVRDRRFQNIVDASRIRSVSGYVTGGKLVASFDSATLPITVPGDKKPIDIFLREGFVVGTLVADGPSWKLSKGVLAGRWTTADILGQIRTIFIKDTVGLKNVYLCDPNLPIDVYAAAKKDVCEGRDLRGSSRDDGKNLPCDAVSAGIRFESYALDAPGPFGDLPVLPARCVKDGSVPVGDDCAPAAP